MGEDIIKQVKPRDDWWENGPLASPIQGLAKENSEDPLDRLILNSGVPSYGFLGSSVLLAIAFGERPPPLAVQMGAPPPPPLCHHIARPAPRRPASLDPAQPR